jgi:hypothetical protein
MVIAQQTEYCEQHCCAGKAQGSSHSVYVPPSALSRLSMVSIVDLTIDNAALRLFCMLMLEAESSPSFLLPVLLLS